ncbi:MAG: hypothetical protein ACTHMG_01075 [Sphingomonas sp.]
MRSLSLTLALAAAALAAGSAVAARHGGDDDAQRDLAKALAGHVESGSVQCIDPRMTEGPQIIGHDTLLYRRGGTVYRANLIGPCPSLREGVTIINEVYGGQLCRNDKFRTLEPGTTIPSSYCRLGDFTVYKPAPKNR